MKIISYIRVSTRQQEQSGLGLEAQQHAIEQFVRSGQHEQIASFREIESGKINSRPELTKALELCRKSKATLVIAKLDRLSRNALFLLTLRDSGVDFVCCDCPNADRFTVGILALVAEREREMISQRTKDGLAAARRRGVRLGNPQWQNTLGKMATARKAQAMEFRSKILPVIAELREAKVSTLSAIAHCLNLRGLKTATGKPFLPQTVCALL